MRNRDASLNAWRDAALTRMEKTDIRRRVKECEGERRGGAVTDRGRRTEDERIDRSLTEPLANLSYRED